MDFGSIDISKLSLPSFQSASLATVTPNPTVSNSSQSGTLEGLSQLANVAGQWGSTIASIVSGRQPTVAPSGTGLSTIPSATNNSLGTILLLGAIVVIVVLVVKK